MFSDQEIRHLRERALNMFGDFLSVEIELTPGVELNLRIFVIQGQANTFKIKYQTNERTLF